MSIRKVVLGRLVATIIAFGVAPAIVSAAVLRVANNGVDSVTCGTLTDPCRTISQAIANASPMDRIVVGPGRYGDLNGNGILGEYGEEKGGACFCVVHVDKKVTVASRDGAGATVIDAAGGDFDVVLLRADEAIFGIADHGFTITKGTFGLVTEGGASGLKARDNIIVDQAGDGFLVHPGSGFVFEGNLAVRNGGNGFAVHGGTGYVFKGNASIANSGSGFTLDGSNMGLQGNLASANGITGFAIAGTGHVLRGNASIGNAGVGVSLGFGGSAAINGNNIFGNDPASNCGLVNESETVIDATNNFWGAATGPGSDPADDVCGNPVTFTPFAAAEFNIPSSWR